MSVSVSSTTKVQKVDSQLDEKTKTIHIPTASDVIKKKADSLQGLLGNATSDVQNISGTSAFIQNYQGGCIIATKIDDAHVFEIHGDIYKKWVGMGSEKFGLPITDETSTPDGVGRYNHFVNGGSIYWLPGIGAHAVYGAIRELWAQNGWEKSSLGYPTSDEMAAPDNVGRMSNFQHGTIYWPSNNNTGAYILPDSHNWTDNIITGGLAALGGNYEIILYRNGNFVFRGHMHDSGSDNYDAQLAVAIVDTLGVAYTFEHKGHTSGTFSSGSRNDDWNNTGSNPTIAKNWGQMRFASYARVFNYDSAISNAVESAISEALKELVQYGVKAATTAIISLV